MIDHIDYSQYASWSFCPWQWYEKYVLRRRKRWPEGLREDALAIGSLVHAGLENWYAHNAVEIPQKEIDKLGPTPEALGLCRRLVYGYVNTYPKEQWYLIRCEQPLRFDLIEGKNGLAKIDLYFYIATPTVVESGIAGYEITLKPGWWIQEYKTKSAATSTADFMKEWVNKMQADFQLLALQHYLQTSEWWRNEDHRAVNGLLVNVIEKPREYVPKRKCKGCGEYWNYSAWLQKMDAQKAGEFVCPGCRHQQKLKPVDGEKFQEPSYFRMVVERTPEQLANSKHDIEKIAVAMQNMEEYGFDSVAPMKEHCFDNSRRWGKECDFFRPHTYGISTLNNNEYEEMEDYINEPTVG